MSYDPHAPSPIYRPTISIIQIWKYICWIYLRTRTNNIQLALFSYWNSTSRLEKMVESYFLKRRNEGPQDMKFSLTPDSVWLRPPFPLLLRVEFSNTDFSLNHQDKALTFKPQLVLISLIYPRIWFDSRLAYHHPNVENESSTPELYFTTKPPIPNHETNRDPSWTKSP